MLVDSHCHLDFPDFSDELENIVERANEQGVGLMLTICTHVTKFQQVLDVATAHDNIFCTVGIHPHEAEHEPETTAAQLIAHTGHSKVVGIGETGLDYYYEHSPKKEQARAFRAHIDAARQTQLPIVIHSRDADDDMMGILEEEMEQGAFPGLLHCFSSSQRLAEVAVSLGLYVSFSGILTFKNAEEIRKTARDLPRERLLVETDSPYLAPVPKRGKRNEPAYVRHTAERLAQELGMSFDELASLTTDNFFNLFSKVPRSAARPC